MRVLIVTNLYPPYYRGGYELRCKQIAEALHRAGHEVLVVTSTFGVSGRDSSQKSRGSLDHGVAVHRCLGQTAFGRTRRMRPWTLFQARAELRDARRFDRLVQQFRPDVINWWNLNGLTKLLLGVPRSRGIPDLYWLEGEWMIEELGPQGEIPLRFWSAVWEGQWGPNLLRPPFRWWGRFWEARVSREGLLTRTFDPSPSHACFVSAFMAELHRNAGFEFASVEIIRAGVPIERFGNVRRTYPQDGALRLLYAGQISPDRGLHTIIEAIALMDPAVRSGLQLGIAGDGQEDYFARVKARIAELGLTDSVRLLGKVTHDRMPDVYRDHDVLVFASSRSEGLPLTLVEAMLSGCAVVTTRAGGAGEVAELAALPTYPANDPQSLRTLMTDLAANRGMVRELGERNRRIAMERFGLEQTVDCLVSVLERLTKL